MKNEQAGLQRAKAELYAQQTQAEAAQGLRHESIEKRTNQLDQQITSIWEARLKLQSDRKHIRIEEIKAKKDQEKVETARREFLEEIAKWYSENQNLTNLEGVVHELKGIAGALQVGGEAKRPRTAKRVASRAMTPDPTARKRVKPPHMRRQEQRISSSMAQVSLNDDRASPSVHSRHESPRRSPQSSQAISHTLTDGGSTNKAHFVDIEHVGKGQTPEGEENCDIGNHKAEDREDDGGGESEVELNDNTGRQPPKEKTDNIAAARRSPSLMHRSYCITRTYAKQSRGIPVHDTSIAGLLKSTLRAASEHARLPPNLQRLYNMLELPEDWTADQDEKFKERLVSTEAEAKNERQKPEDCMNTLAKAPGKGQRFKGQSC